MIEVNNLSKFYRGFSSNYQRIFSVISLGLFSGTKSYFALDSISFQAKPGEIIGIIGRNGAGKSTLLKILSGVSHFDSGTVKIHGVLRPMLELGVGFNAELTGRENILFNGLLWGYSKSELKFLENQIFEFAGLLGYEDQILKNYSTGMIMRLGFALATANRPDVLLIDEALAVGDASFQIKCLDRFKEFLARGSTILVVSHDLQLMGAICTKILVLEKGKSEFFGATTPALRKYIEILGRSESKSSFSEDLVKNFSIELIDENSTTKNIFFIGNQVSLIFKFQFKEKIKRVTAGFQIDDSRGIRVYGINTHILKKEILDIAKDFEYKVKFTFPLNFREGKYSIGISLHEGDSHTEGCYLWKDAILDFEIERIDQPKFDGLVYLPTKCEWSRVGDKE